jgi:hypothetical protein
MSDRMGSGRVTQDTQFLRDDESLGIVCCIRHTLDW